MPPKPKILFLGNVPASADQGPDAFVILESAEDRRPYREAVIKPASASLSYPSDFSDPEIPEGSVAYHPVFGEITYNSRWYFSTARLMADLSAAEENPSIVAHVLHIDSPGGEAFGLHEAFDAIRNLKKPCHAVIGSMAASAGYYLAAGADRVYASAMFSMVGCIGIVGLFYDDRKYLEKIGFEEREYYSSYSPLKNKVFRDARDGNGDEYIRRYLDPMALRFIEDVKGARTGITQAAQEGDTFYSDEAVAAGLIDGVKSFDDALRDLIEAISSNEKSPSIDINQLNLCL